MKKSIIENNLILISSILFYLLFWKEKMGLNILIFTSILLSFLFINRPSLKEERPIIITSIGTLSLAVLVVLINSSLSKLVFLFSFTILVGLAKQKELRFLGYGFLLSFVSFFESPIKLLKQTMSLGKTSSVSLAPLWRSVRISVIPVIIIFIFYGIYHLSNPAFRSFSNSFWEIFANWFSWNISLPQIFFFIFGLLISGTILLKSEFPFFINLQKKYKENLIRKRRKHTYLTKGMIALKSEFQSGLILLASLNLLLLVVNILDYKTFFTKATYQMAPYEMSSMVHDSTNMLIFALLLAMVVISYFFRKNLNFYKKNKALKTMGYLWMAQNGVLAISLLIKNYLYIESNGLAYKRIGVLIFLLLVIAGLFTMVLKIRDQKTFYFLLHKNTWVAYSIFIICSCINWDAVITKYNLSHQAKTEIDYRFLVFNVSNKNLPLLYEQRKMDLSPTSKLGYLDYALTSKKNTFIKKQAPLTWLSWNYADYKTMHYLESEGLISTK